MTIESIESQARNAIHDLPSKANTTQDVSTIATAIEGAVQEAVDAALPAMKDGAAQLVSFSKRKPIISIAAAGAVGYAIYRASRSRRAA